MENGKPISRGNLRLRHNHLVAMPYPGRGHVNPMLNLCSLILSSQPDLLISFVVTEEWFGFLSSDTQPPPPASLRFVTVPQVIPSEIGRATSFAGFFEAVSTKLQDPFERILDGLDPPATAIIYDTFLGWLVEVGNRRNIPVASLFTQSASMFSLLSHFDLLIQHGHFPLDSDTSDPGMALIPGGEEKVDYIPGLPPTSLADLPTFFNGVGREVLPRVLETISAVNKAQYLLFTSVHELEEQVINALKAKLPIPVYPVGPTIPYLELESKDINHDDNHSYFRWLDSQAQGSVLYISQGSFLSVSSDQMDEIVAGVKDSGVRFLWVTRGDHSRFGDGFGEMGCLVPWCDQLKVLCHPSVGGFWTHCGWNSTLEGVYAGVPMLTCPIFWDQLPNNKLIVSDWKIGCEVMKNNDHKKTLVARHEIARIVRDFMDAKANERKDMVGHAKKLQEVCRKAMINGGSTAFNLTDFISKFLD